ncbi:MAG: hydrogenase maturation nickel metallochaperone HypA [Gammaproteobacteria bacterium]
MHEASLMRGLMKQVEAIAAAHGGERVVSIEVWLGALSHMSPAHFEAHFAAVAPGTRAAGARLVIETSDDPAHPHAQDIVLQRVEIETGDD